jgi:hypothetical protein
MENYSRSNNNSNNNDLKQLKAELTELLEEEAKADKLRIYLCIAAELLAGNRMLKVL